MRTRTRRIAATTTLLLALGASACSSSSKQSQSTASTATTVHGATTPPGATTPGATTTAAPYAAAGPYAVGYTTLRLPDGRRAVVWYPAAKNSTAGLTRESIDIASLLSPALQAKIPAKDRVLYPANAYLNAPPAPPGHFPVVIFSHGFAGYPEQSVTLTTHLASWGFVVAAPDHVERSLDGLLGTAATGVAKSNDVAVLKSTLDTLEKSAAGTGVLHGMIDPAKVVAGGHSAGAGAAYAFASADPRVKAWISYSVGFGGQAGAAPAAPAKPGMVMLGTTDGIIAPAKSESVYGRMQTPKYLVRIDNAGHLVFSDICLIGRSAGGITGIARAINLPIPASLLKLGSDGCESTHPPVEKAFPAIDDLSVAFYRWALGIDATPQGLSTDAVANLGAKVSVDHAG